ncbi:DUF4157 domain-containing protein [Coleofasciculus sp. FACHB-125]|nr:DUF4157 domain-containing protein [Coleofasciculus sp. FACHB-125]
MGGVPSVSSHAAMLNRSPVAGKSSNQQLVFQLQRQYGNRYVNQVVQMARRAETKAVGESIGVSEAHQENRTGLPDNLKAGIESLSSISMDDVKVHYNSDKPGQLQALAYTQGPQIHVAPGQEEHLPHEAWHVVQQMQGRVKPTMQMKRVQVNDAQGLEEEADVMGAKAFTIGQQRYLRPQQLPQNFAAETSSAYDVVQMQDDDEPPALSDEELSILLDDDEPPVMSEETWGEWFWRHKWKFLAAGITILTAYALYKKYGGMQTIEPAPSSPPPGPSVNELSAPTPSSPPPGPSVNELSAPTSSSPPPGPSPVNAPSETHAWPVGKIYTPLDKAKGLFSILPGGGLAVETLEQIVAGKPDGAALLAETVKLHPYAWPARVYDGVAIALSYYSDGKIEIGQTKNLIENIFRTS